jgi:hypothetical protein
LALVGLAAPAGAATITGHLGIAGGLGYATLNLTGGTILDFSPLGTAATGGTAAGNGTGTVVTLDIATGYFTGIPTFPLNGLNAATATTKDLTNVALAPYGSFAPAGVVGTPLVGNFLNGFTSAILPAFFSTLHFDLTEVLLAPGSTCTGLEIIGQSCVEGPFALNDTATGLSITFDVLGNFVNQSGADTGFYDGTYTLTVNGLHFQSGNNGSDGLFRRLDVTGQDILCGVNNDTTPCTFSANFDPATGVPEPITLLTLGTGSMLVAAAVRRRKARKQ